jgi:hypothetical protein
LSVAGTIGTAMAAAGTGTQAAGAARDELAAEKAKSVPRAPRQRSSTRWGSPGSVCKDNEEFAFASTSLWNKD